MKSRKQIFLTCKFSFKRIIEKFLTMSRLHGGLFIYIDIYHLHLNVMKNNSGYEMIRKTLENIE